MSKFKIETKRRNKAITGAFVQRQKCISCRFAKIHSGKYPQVSFCFKWKETVDHFEDTCEKWERTPKPKDTTEKHLQFIIDNICQ